MSKNLTTKETRTGKRNARCATGAARNPKSPKSIDGGQGAGSLRLPVACAHSTLVAFNFELHFFGALYMDKFRCTHTIGRDGYTYYVDVIANNESHAKELASMCVKDKSYFTNNVDPRDWNVSELDSGYSGPAKVVDYGKL